MDQAHLPRRDPPAARHMCPVPGCCAGQRARQAGWETFAGLRTSMPTCWGCNQAGHLRIGCVSCRICSRLVSHRCHGGLHRACAAQAFADRPPPTLPDIRADADVALVLASLPSMDDICVAAIATRETLGEGLLPLAEREFLRCIAAVLEHNCEDAWDDPDGVTDTPQRRLCRLAWTQLWMFAKTCLTALPGGRAKQRRNRNILANRLNRWGLGERRSLWDEAVKAAANSSARRR